MLKYEIKNIFLSKIILISTTCLLLFNCINIFKNHYHKDEMYDAYVSVYEEIKGNSVELCKGFIEEKLNNINMLPEEKRFLFSQVYSNVLEELDSISQYSYDSMEIAEKSREKAMSFKNRNGYLFELNTKIADAFNGREIKEFRNVNKYPELISYKFSDWLVILLLVTGISGIFSGDRENGTYAVIKATKKGYRKISYVKILSCQIFTIIISTLFFCCNYICFKICYQFDGLKQPVYAIEAYRNVFVNVPSNDSIGLFIIKTFIFSTLGFCVISMIITFMSVIFQNTKLTILGTWAAIIGLVFYRLRMYLGIGKIINLLNPIQWMISEKMYLYFENVNIEDKMIMSKSAAFFAAIGWIVLFTYVISVIYSCNFSLYTNVIFQPCKSILNKKKAGGTENEV